MKRIVIVLMGSVLISAYSLQASMNSEQSYNDKMGQGLFGVTQLLVATGCGITSLGFCTLACYTGSKAVKYSRGTGSINKRLAKNHAIAGAVSTGVSVTLAHTASYLWHAGLANVEQSQVVQYP